MRYAQGPTNNTTASALNIQNVRKCPKNPKQIDEVKTIKYNVNTNTIYTVQSPNKSTIIKRGWCRNV